MILYFTSMSAEPGSFAPTMALAINVSFPAIYTLNMAADSPDPLREMLLQQGVDPVLFDCEDGAVHKVSAFLEAGGDVHMQHELHADLISTAISKGHSKIVELLLSHGLDVRRTSEKFQYTPLHLVRSQPNAESIARLLLEAGADPNAKDKYGGTPLMGAAGDGNLALMSTLISNGADPDQTGHDGKSAFYFAAIEGQLACAQRLLELGTDINACDNRGKSALHWAAQRGNEKAVRWLVDHGADKGLRDDSKRTALDWAKENGHMELVPLLS